MGMPVHFSARVLVLAPIALCLVVMIVSGDAFVRALMVVPLALLIVLRDIMLLKDMEAIRKLGESKSGKAGAKSKGKAGG